VSVRRVGSTIPQWEGHIQLAGRGPADALCSTIGTGVKALGALAGSERTFGGG